MSVALDLLGQRASEAAHASALVQDFLYALNADPDQRDALLNYVKARAEHALRDGGALSAHRWPARIAA